MRVEIGKANGIEPMIEKFTRDTIREWAERPHLRRHKELASELGWAYNRYVGLLRRLGIFTEVSRQLVRNSLATILDGGYIRAQDLNADHIMTEDGTIKHVSDSTEEEYQRHLDNIRRINAIEEEELFKGDGDSESLW